MSKKTKPLRKVGDIMLDMEKLLFELHEGHDMQHGEVLYLINGWQKVHVPDQIETYIEDGTHPVLYGPAPKVRNATIAQLESEALLKVMHEVNWNLNAASIKLGLGRATIYRKLKQYNLSRHK